jgi:hypothetical protein
MNTRCYRCGWSFTLSREAVEAAAVSSAGEKAHVMHCPRCRQAIRIPMDQIMRSVPPGWQPPAEVDGQATPMTTEPDGESTGSSKTTGNGQTAVESAATPRSGRRHRHSGKPSTSNPSKSAAEPAAKLTTHQRS